nr:hypothetical protein Itr_chr15CG03010 [Ipomoea trifida]GMD99264.1 hypothetical protein Iba_chr15eCG2150 [Ipomoea batatas]
MGKEEISFFEVGFGKGTGTFVNGVSRARRWGFRRTVTVLGHDGGLFASILLQSNSLTFPVRRSTCKEMKNWRKNEFSVFKYSVATKPGNRVGELK